MSDQTPETPLAEEAIRKAMQGEKTFCKFLSANDTGETGGHQSGIYISKPAVPIIFDHPFEKGENHERTIKIIWQGEFETEGHCKYYGQGTRNEYRITGFGHGFPYLHAEYTGALFVLIQMSHDDYCGYVLNTDAEIDQFLDAYGLTPPQTNRLLKKNELIPELREKTELQDFLKRIGGTFPTSEEMSSEARLLSYLSGISKNMVIEDPDRILVYWTESEYRLFKAIEYNKYGARVRQGFDNIDDFMAIANQLSNRRKSRAGKSLEHHLEAIFDGNSLNYSAQAITEERKKPDFIFPSIEAYHDMTFNADDIITLAAKTTCKDRWRQILNEADRRKDKPKYLCTLQQGISSNQIEEMHTEQVVLVVPKQYIKTFPADRYDMIWPISRFISFVKEKEGLA